MLGFVDVTTGVVVETLSLGVPVGTLDDVSGGVVVDDSLSDGDGSLDGHCDTSGSSCPTSNART